MSNNKHTPPDFSQGFVDVQYINTFLNLIVTGKPILLKDAYLWLDKKGYPTKRAENTLKLLVYASVIEEDNERYVGTADFLQDASRTNQEQALQRFILASIPDDDLRLFLKNAYMPYEGFAVWKPESVSPFLVQLRDFLISLRLLQYESGLIRATNLFARYLVSRGMVDTTVTVKGRTVSAEELLVALAVKDELGDKAEKIALEFESNRTASFGKRPVRISENDVAAGYDIESYEKSTSKEFDRHIEVKYFNNGHFYFSKNEIQVAKTLGPSYWIYLVTFNDEKSHSVEMINDPYSSIVNSGDWAGENMLVKFSRVIKNP